MFNETSSNLGSGAARDKRKVTLREVAMRAGVALGTASNVLANRSDVPVTPATQAAVLAAAHELGYEPRQRLAASQSRRVDTLGLVIRAETNAPWLTCHFYSSVLYGAEQACAARGIGLMYATVDQDASQPRDLPPMIQRKQVQGLLVLGYFGPSFFALMPNIAMPYVVLDHHAASLQTDSVTSDDEAGGYAATRLLLDRVPCPPPPAMIGGPVSHASIAGRLAGYRHALRDAGVPCDESYIRSGDLRSTGGYGEMNALLDLPVPPTAVFCCNDETAQGALAALHARNIAIPDRCSVVGFDDLELAAHTAPPLTTMRVEKGTLGAQGVWHLLERIEHPDLPPRNTCISVRLIERASVRSLQQNRTDISPSGTVSPPLPARS